MSYNWLKFVISQLFWNMAKELRKHLIIVLFVGSEYQQVNNQLITHLHFLYNK